MKELNIGEVARRSGLKVSAIRYYESLGLLPTARRVRGHRRFQPDVFERLDFIRMLQQVGFSLEQVFSLSKAFETSDSPAALCRGMARQKLAEVDQLIARLKDVRRTLADSLDCDCADINECAYTLNMTK